MKNKFLCAFILILIILTYVFPIISSANYTKYVALGDSIPQGYTMLYGVLEKNSYPQKFRQKSNISQNNYKNLSFQVKPPRPFTQQFKHLNIPMQLLIQI